MKKWLVRFSLANAVSHLIIDNKVKFTTCLIDICIRQVIYNMTYLYITDKIIDLYLIGKLPRRNHVRVQTVTILNNSTFVTC